jgi:hypothetical protein
VATAAFALTKEDGSRRRPYSLRKSTQRRPAATKELKSHAKTQSRKGKAEETADDHKSTRMEGVKLARDSQDFVTLAICCDVIRYRSFLCAFASLREILILP